MKWIIDDIRRAWRQLLRWQTWLVLGLMGGFAALIYLVARYAFRTDSILSFLHLTSGQCRTMTNGLIIAMFSGMVFFALTVLATFGELQHYLIARQKNASREARKALTWTIVWGCSALTIAIAALSYFKANCY